MENNENRENRELKASSVAKREKKKERREAKAARKEANKVEEKRTRPNNIILGILIFGVLIGMFAFVKGYGYFSKPVDLAKYIEENGGAESFSGMQMDMYTTADITAEGNSLNIVLNSTAEGDAAEELKTFYGGDDGKEQLEYIGSYFLTIMKPQVRGFSADVTVTANLNGEELNKVNLTYKEAKKVMEPDEEEAEEDAAATEDADAEATEDAAATEEAATEDAAATEEAATEDAAGETEGE